MKKIYSLAVSLVAVSSMWLAFGAKQVNADSGIGVSPTSIRNSNILPGSHLEYKFKILSSDTTNDSYVTVDKHINGFENWVTFDPQPPFKFSGKEKEVTIKIDVPNTVKYGDSFKGYVAFVQTDQSLAGQSYDGIPVLVGAAVNFDLKISNEKLEEVTVQSVDIASTTRTDLPLEVTVKYENTGNVDVTALKADISFSQNGDEFGRKAIEGFKSIRPTQNITDKFEVVHGLEKGTYLAKVRVFLGDKELYSFDKFIEVSPKAGTPVEKKDLTGVAGFITKITSSPATVGLMMVVLVLLTAYVTSKVVSKKVEGQSTPKRKLAKLYLPLFIVSMTGLTAVYTFVLSEGLNFNVPKSEKIAVKTTPTPEVKAPVTGGMKVISGNDGKDVLGVATGPSADCKFPVSSQTQGSYNLYNSASENANVVTTVSEGTTLKVVDSKDCWYVVNYNGSTLYLPKSSVKAVNK